MRLAWIFILSILFLNYQCRKDSPSASVDESVPKEVSKTELQPIAELIDFKSGIQPILQTRCSPCHFPGGKMYAKMPFDSASTIKSHKEGILRRIKDSAENEKIKAFVEQSSK